MSKKSHVRICSALGVVAAVSLASACGTGSPEPAANDSVTAETLERVVEPPPAPERQAEPSEGFALAVDGYSATSHATTPQVLVPDLEFDQAVLDGRDGVRVTLTASTLAEPIDQQEQAYSVNAEYSVGFVADGLAYLEVAVSGATSGSSLESVLAVLRDSELTTLASDIALFEMDGFTLTDLRRDWLGRGDVEASRTTYVGRDSESVVVTWRPVPEGLSLEVAATPLIQEVRTLGDRQVAVISSVAGEPARATWIEGMHLVTVAGGSSIDEVLAYVRSTQRVDQLDLTAIEDVSQFPQVSTWKLPNTNQPLALRSNGERNAICTTQSCSELGVVSIATVINIDGTDYLVGAFPLGGDAAVLTLDGEAVKQSTVGDHAWFSAELANEPKPELVIQVGEIVLDPISLEQGES